MPTSDERKKPSKPRRLSPQTLARAKPIAARYRITLWREDGEWYGQGVEEPGAMGDGRTITQCLRSVREALAVVVASNMEHGEPVITPIVDQEREQTKAG